MRRTIYKRKKIIITAILILFACEAYAAENKKDVAKGNMLYNSKKYDEAIASFNKALEKAPDDAVANYNLGNALYRKGDFAKAVESYNKALVKEESIRQKGDYNIGNGRFRIGKSRGEKDPASAMKDYRDSLEYYIRAMELDPGDTDAKFNYEFVEREMKVTDQKPETREQKPENREHKTENREQKAAGREQKTEDREQKAKDREQSTENREQKAEDREQSTENRAQRTEDREKEQEKKQDEPSEQEEKKGEGLEFYQKPEGGKEMTPQEAKMLLESYGQEGETRKQVRLRKFADYPEPDKDW